MFARRGVDVRRAGNGSGAGRGAGRGDACAVLALSRLGTVESVVCSLLSALVCSALVCSVRVVSLWPRGIVEMVADSQVSHSCRAHECLDAVVVMPWDWMERRSGPEASRAIGRGTPSPPGVVVSSTHTPLSALAQWITAFAYTPGIAYHNNCYGIEGMDDGGGGASRGGEKRRRKRRREEEEKDKEKEKRTK